IGDATLADDITQEAFVRLLQADTSKLQAPQVRAYLYRIATNLMHDHRRRSGREVRDDDAALEMPDPADDTAAVRLDVGDAFDRLPPNQRMLLWLAYVEGYGHREIAEMMSLREKSVRVLLFRARHRLAGLLREVGVDGKDVR
ncbi:MAG TPA: RNA polymerase sigma factor, partial [Candidatus Krumholzibacteria bacterium]|nr:RNA polymerase sigma factor [Candidatus Krumholzibacteria bacterium]